MKVKNKLSSKNKKANSIWQAKEQNKTQTKTDLKKRLPGKDCLEISEIY
jgi:hypothetical protein